MNAKKLISIIILSGILFSSFRSPVHADGIILPPEPYPTYETEQKALIIYNDNHEDLVISVSFSGEAKNFGWLVPLPNKPDISKVDSSIFRKLQDFTIPKENLLDKIRGDDDYYYGYTNLEMSVAGDQGKDRTTVEVIEEKSIGIFDYAILTTEKVDDLKDWMEENSYSLPNTSADDDWLFENPSDDGVYISDSDAWSNAKPIIQDYIDDNWYFVAIKVNNEFTESSGTTSQLSSGAVDPLRFSFETTDMLYPMKLTGIGMRNISALIYVISDHKERVENYNYDYCDSDDEDCSYFEITYAGNIKKNEIEELTKEVGKGNWYQAEKNMVITKLHASNLPYTAMTEEVLFTDTKDKKGVNDGSMSFGEWLQLPFVLVIHIPYIVLGGFLDIFGESYYGYDLGAAWFISIMVMLFIGSIIWIISSYLFLRRCKKRALRVLLYALQIPAVWIVSFIVSLLIVLPVAIAITPFVRDEGIILLDGVCCFSFLTVLLPLLFYRIVWRRMNRNKS